MPKITHIHGYEIVDQSAHKALAQFKAENDVHFSEIGAAMEEASQESGKSVYYVTPQMFGAKGDGVTDDTTAFANALLAEIPNIKVPAGVYRITDTLRILKSRMTSMEITDGAIIKADFTGEMIRCVTDTGSTPCRTHIHGAGCIMLDGKASCGVFIESGNHDCIVEGVSIRAIGENAAGIIVGNSALSTRAVINRVRIVGNNNTPSGSTAIRFIDHDAHVSDIVALYVEKGFDVQGGGNLFNNIHIWSGDLAPDNDKFSGTVGVHVAKSSNYFNNIYIDNFFTGFVCDESLQIDNVFFYLPYPNTADPMKPCVFKMDKSECLRCGNLNVNQEGGYTPRIIAVDDVNSGHMLAGAKRYVVSHNVTNTNDFDLIDEAFNLRANNFAECVNSVYQAETLNNPVVLLGYLACSGVYELRVTHNHTACIKLEGAIPRGNEITAAMTRKTYVHGSASTDDIVIIYGRQEIINGLPVQPVYATGTEIKGYIGVSFKGDGLAGFYLNHNKTLTDSIVTDYNELFRI